jgi:hypothetical protein
VLFCLLGLFFLLVKEDRTTGVVQVTVQGPNLMHTTAIAVFTPGANFDVMNRVAYAQQLAR